MDVSAISTYKPQYDWRNMTAKEIIKHDDDGDKVPAMYLKWAVEFLQSVYSDDVTTYEVAVSRGNKSNTEVTLTQSQSETSVEGEEEEDEPKLSEAQQLRLDMQQDGMSLTDQAILFRKMSRSLTSEIFAPLIIIKALEDTSGEEVGKAQIYLRILDSQMESFWNNLHLLIDAGHVQNSEGDHDAEVERAQKEAQRLNAVATKAHGNVSQTELTLDGIGAEMASFNALFGSAIDYGGVAVDVGREVGTHGGLFWFLSLGSSTEHAGLRAIRSGHTGFDFEAEGQNINNDNLGIASDMHDYITEKSGIDTPNKEDYRRDAHGNRIKTKKPETAERDDKNKPESDYDPKDKNLDSKKIEDVKKEDKDLPKDREQLVKLVDNDKNTKGQFVKNASKMTTVQDAPSKKEFADDNQKIEAANEFDKAKSNDGADERTVTLALREQSKSADEKAVAGLGTSKLLAQMSQASYNELDENIQELMNEINSTEEEIKNEIRALNSGSTSDISKINQLNEEIRAYGSSAQMVTGSYEGIINGYASELDNIGDAFSDAITKGNMAASAGSQIIANSEDRWLAFRLVNEIIGKSAINIGERSAGNGVKGIAEKTQASSTINSNLLSIASLKSEIQAKTGVSGVSAKSKAEQASDNGENDNSLIPAEEHTEDITKPNLEKPKEVVKDSEKAVKIAQNDGTDTNDKQNTDINAIMARKVRRGEVYMG